MKEYENTLGQNVALSELRRVERERDDYKAKYEFMVERACNEKLDGYRELADKCAKLEQERDEARAEAVRARREGAEAMREELVGSIEELVLPENLPHEVLARAARAVRHLVRDLRRTPLPGDDN